MGMMGKSVALQDQLSSYDSQIKKLDQQIEEEEERTTEIDDLKEYMKTDEYVEETAREKLGLVKENEIVFKEGDSEEKRPGYRRFRKYTEFPGYTGQSK